MRMFLSKRTVRVPVFSSTWLFSSLGFFIFWQFLDGFTTKIGLDLGLAEVGTYAMGVLNDYGFWGLMVWKYSIIAAIGVIYLLFYYGVKKYDFAHLKVASMILAVGCIFAFIGTVQVVMSNILQIQLAL